MRITIVKFNAGEMLPSGSALLSQKDSWRITSLRGRKPEGFSLVEVLMAITISGILIASVMGTFIGFSRSIRGVEAYAEMNKSSRETLAVFARDVRAARSVTQATDSSLHFTLPAVAPYNGRRLEYTYNSTLDTFSRVERDSGGTQLSSRILLDGVEQFVFSYFNPSGAALPVGTPSLPLSIKGVQLEASLQRSIYGTSDKTYTTSGRYSMRNRFSNP